MNNDLYFTRFIVNKKANVNLAGHLGNTALHYAFK